MLTKAYPTPSGTASITWYCVTWYWCPSGDASRFSARRLQLGPILHALAPQKECQIIEAHLMPDHVHMCIAMPPKLPVASVIGFLKGKSAIAIARRRGKDRNFT